MASYTIPDVGKKYLLDYKLGLAGPPAGANLSNAKLHLCKDTSTFTANPRDQILGDFVEATFAGYAAVVIGPWSAALYDGSAFDWYSLSQLGIFTSTDAVNSFNLGGWYLTDNASANLIAFTEFSPVEVIGPLASKAYQLRMDEISEFNN